MFTVSIAFLVMLIGLIFYIAGQQPETPRSQRWSEVFKYMFIVGLFWVLANTAAIVAFFGGK